MERGLMWLPLLVGFGVLAWLGWSEHRKVEAYRAWAQTFDHSKYDLHAMLGWADRHLSWGKPTRQGPVSVQSVDLDRVENVRLQVDGVIWNGAPESLPQRGTEIYLVLLPQQHQIPFTQLPLALAWWRKLNQALERSGPETPG